MWSVRRWAVAGIACGSVATFAGCRSSADSIPDLPNHPHASLYTDLSPGGPVVGPGLAGTLPVPPAFPPVPAALAGTAPPRARGDYSTDPRAATSPGATGGLSARVSLARAGKPPVAPGDVAARGSVL